MRTVRCSVLDARRWLCLFLVCCIILCGIGGIHQRAQAVAVLSAEVVAIIISAMAAMGITFSLTGAFDTVEDWILGVIDESSIDFSGVQYGVNGLGNLLMNNRFVRSVSALATYIQAKLSLQDNSTVVINNGDVTIGDIVMYGGSSGQFEDKTNPGKGVKWIIDSGSPLHCFHYMTHSSTLFQVLFFSSAPFTLRVSNYTTLSSGSYNSTVYESVQSGTNFYYNVFTLQASEYVTPYMTVYNYTTSEMLEILNGGTLVQGNYLAAKAGTIDIPSDYDIGSLNGVLSLPVPWGLTLPQVLEGIEPLVLTDGLAGTTAIDLVPTADIADQIDQPATNADPPISDLPSDYTSPGLENVFPFCIPFDIFNLLSALAADPVAPAFAWRFYVPGICDENITVDLSPFDTVAQVVRTVELLAFIIGLAMVTRERFLRG